MTVTEAQLRQISKLRSPKTNLLASIIAIADEFNPHQMAHVLAQVMHESGGLYYDREIWGPTAAQKRYEGRADLGNTQPGDGAKFPGYGPIQLTGRGNVTAFYRWCVEQGLNPPDFTKHPEQITEAPWAGWSVVWYWTVGNPTGKSLNRYADINDIEMITRRVNGGLNGFGDRLEYYDRSALVLLGYGPTEIKAFQLQHGLEPDGISGPKTRAGMHKALVAMTAGEAERPEVQTAPVVEEKTVSVPVPVDKPTVPPAVEEKVKKKFNLFGWISGLFGTGGLSLAGLAGMEWQAIVAIGGVLILVLVLAIVLRQQIIGGIKDIKRAVES